MLADEVSEDSRWRLLADWKADLAPHFATAQQMMGETTALLLHPLAFLRLLSRVLRFLVRHYVFTEYNTLSKAPLSQTAGTTRAAAGSASETMIRGPRDAFNEVRILQLRDVQPSILSSDGQV